MNSNFELMATKNVILSFRSASTLAGKQAIQNTHTSNIAKANAKGLAITAASPLAQLWRILFQEQSEMRNGGSEEMEARAKARDRGGSDKLVILVDMDGTIADFESDILRRFRERYYCIPQPMSLTGVKTPHLK